MGIDLISLSIAKKYGAEVDKMFAYDESPNVFNGNLNDGFMHINGRVTADANYQHTDFIEVKNKTFIITADYIINERRVNVPLRFVTAFDADKNVLSTYGLQQVGADNSYIDDNPANALIITLDERVKYMVLTIYKPANKYNNFSISFDVSAIQYIEYGLRERSDKLKEELIPYNRNIKKECLAEYLKGKTIAVFGDSIMWGEGGTPMATGDILAEKYGMNLEKYCASGSTMGIRTDNPAYTVDEIHHIAKQVRNAIADGIKPDFIIFNGGTNDISCNLPLGEMSTVYTQPTTEAYFADGFETVAWLLTKNFVDVPIIYMRPHNMSSRTYDGQISYGELGNKISDKWGIHKVDMYVRMNTQLEEYRTKYLIDYTHPNRDGYETYYVPALENYIFEELM